MKQSRLVSNLACNFSSSFLPPLRPSSSICLVHRVSPLLVTFSPMPPNDLRTTKEYHSWSISGNNILFPQIQYALVFFSLYFRLTRPRGHPSWRCGHRNHRSVAVVTIMSLLCTKTEKKEASVIYSDLIRCADY